MLDDLWRWLILARTALRQSARNTTGGGNEEASATAGGITHRQSEKTCLGSLGVLAIPHRFIEQWVKSGVEERADQPGWRVVRATGLAVVSCCGLQPEGHVGEINSRNQLEE